jgi:hypothetical protein
VEVVRLHAVQSSCARWGRSIRWPSFAGIRSGPSPGNGPGRDWNCGRSAQQFPIYPTKLWSGGSPPPSPLPDNTQGWGFSVYRYKITWDRDQVSWFVDTDGTGNGYAFLRSQDISKFGYPTLLYPFISFWTGWTPDGSPFLNGQDATAKFKLPVNKYGNAVAAPCYQAFYFQSLKFTPSKANTITKLIE